jgi:5-deoxy-5-amino-3-dehydroquinate synthase
MAKYHFLGGEDLDDLPLEEKVARCVAIKAAVVATDEKETPGGAGQGHGLRATLNYGHTLAHALETAGRYDLRHGEAVGIGLVFAAELARRRERIDDGRVEYHRKVVEGYGLPSRLPHGADADQLVTLMGRDKKAVRGLTFVLDGAAGVAPVPDVPVEDVLLALEAVR